jgi:Peptidase family M23
MCSGGRSVALVPRITVALLLLLLPAPAAAAASWQRPVDGPVLRAFLVRGDPYARGQHRGVDLGAPVGAGVRSACAGRVTFAGRVPGGGRTVSVRCGAMAATYQQLGTIVARAGGSIAAGAVLGTVGRSNDPRTASPHLHLGARVTATGRYLDPLSLLGHARPALPPIALGERGRPRAAPLGPAPAPALAQPAPLAPLAAPARAPASASARSAPRPPASAPRSISPVRDGAPNRAPTVPWFVWAGLASVGLALPIGGLMTARGRRRREVGHAVLARR